MMGNKEPKLYALKKLFVLVVNRFGVSHKVTGLATNYLS